MGRDPLDEPLYEVCGEYLQKIIDRDIEIKKMNPICPNCKENHQIQIISKKRPAVWKCRMCNFKSVSEC